MLEWFYEKAAARGICEAAAKKKAMEVSVHGWTG